MRIKILEMNVGAYGESNIHPVSHKWAVMLERMQNVLWQGPANFLGRGPRY